ncbi:hypothetical protein IMSAG249_02514 [Lachnospiraceae bacterium]|jgi:hypothetical protein|nr:hypothetical protein IMSAGC009_01574 [Lachnospiraceae bacterium]GFI70685.1 hypothetical protein IMSAG249_02514 [Lachnospiraceae bacterium]
MKKILSGWSKTIKKLMIDYDMDMADVAQKVRWSTQYTSAIINGRTYQKESVNRISQLFGIDIPEENTTLAKERESLNRIF